VEPSPAGGYFVKLRGEHAPLSRHDTEEEAAAAAAAYDRGLARQDAGEHILLSDGSEVVVRPVRPEDTPLFAETWWRLGSSPEVDHVDHEAIGAVVPRRAQGVGVARYVRSPERPHVAAAAVVVADAWQRRGLGTKLLRRLGARARENGIHVFTAGLLSRDPARLRVLGELGKVTVTREEGAAVAVEVEMPVDPEALDHMLRAAAAGER